MESATTPSVSHSPWNKGKLVGQKAPLRLKDIWAIRVRLQLAVRTRELAMFNLAIDSKLRACDLVKLRVSDICHGDRVSPRAIVMQQKTQRPVQFEITEATRESVGAWLAKGGLRSGDFLFPSRIHESPHLSTRQYARIVGSWVRQIGLDRNNLSSGEAPTLGKLAMEQRHLWNWVVFAWRERAKCVLQRSPRADALDGVARAAVRGYF